MTEIIYYLIIGQLVLFSFYLGWRLVLVHQKNYVFNRFWLLSGILMALLPSMIRGLLPSNGISSGLSQEVVLPLVEVGRNLSSGSANSGVDWLEALGLLYLVGIGLSLLRLIYGFVLIIRVRQKSLSRQENIFFLPDLESHQAFSFFKWIFIPDSSDQASRLFLLTHERTHSEQWHSVDVILAELCQSIHWFSPLGKFYLKAMRDNHEFIVDQKVLEHTGDRESYINNLVRAHRSKLQISLVHSFSNQSSLKNRLTMMHTKQSKSSLLLKALAVPFFIGATFIACSKAEVTENLKQESPSSEVLKTADVMPEFPGGNEAFMQYMMANIKYPEIEKESGIEGKVMVSFVVGKDGKIKDAKVVRSVNESLDQAALEVVNSMPDWKPGTMDAKPVDVQMTLPVLYQLD